MNENIRDYEVSVWTLQDSFLTVLKPSGIDNKGRIEEPDFDLKNDGTLTFKFSIPMYLKENNVQVENPIWYDTTNGNIIADLRKIKVIFHKNTEYEHIFELLITKVTESHEGFQLTCDVECEDLAFHELGKIGYKLSLNQDTFIDDWTEWANDSNAMPEDEPKSNIDYWCDKVFENTNWEYEIQMDWSGYDTSRESDMIYEDAYAAAWDVRNDKFIPTTVVKSKEKERLIDVEESNRYNITQTIAETFGVHCRYEYEHDSDYHITKRKVIFYNAFVQEALGPIDINYAYDTTDISREMDSKDTITKMYVKTLTDSNTESGLATIADTTANKSQEDYLLNFDYLYSIGTISQEQYDAVEPYEIEMHRFNKELKRYEKQMSTLENRRIDAAAAEAVANNAISLDNERISANNDLLNSITNNTGEIEVGAARPDTCAVLGDSRNYYIVLRQKGIIPNSIKIYKAFTPGTGFDDEDKVLSYKLNYDEFGNLTKITDIVVTFTANQILYLTYKYSPRLYYENIVNTWKKRLARDLNEQQTQAAIVNEIDNELELLKAEKEDLLEQKKEAIKRFEHLMGAAIREGYWQPEDEYAKYGEKKIEILTLNSAAEFNDNLSSIGWDNELFEGEDKNYYEIEITQTKEYYPCITLPNLNVFRNDDLDLNKISFIYQDTTVPQEEATDDIRYLRFLPIGSQCQLRFLRDSENVIPVLMLTGLKDVNYDIFNNSYSHPRIGILTTEVNNGSIDSNIYVIMDEATVRQNLISSSAATSYEIVYPRIQINSANLKVTEDSLVLRYGNIVFNNYEDYYVLSRLDNVTNIFRYYITIKPEVLFKKSKYGSYNLLYELSNTGLFMYLDALQVLKENAYPRVSYEIKPTFVNTDFIRYAYKYLNYIVHINDPELKFEYVKGYITELHLKLDSPKDDSITIDNYKTKFEDLFSTIVAQTQQMQKNSTLIGMAAQAFTNAGELQPNLVQSVMDRVDLNYAFNNGTLTINEEDGIWGASDDGVVAFRGGGIFTATEKDSNGEWIWNTGILPSGINASLITTGQLDTNLIRIFAGDDLKLQMNGDGLFAYRSQWNNNNHTIAADDTRPDGLDLGQYVVHNGDGVFLRAEKGTGVKFDFDYYDSNITIAQVQSQDTGIFTSFDGLLVAYIVENNSYLGYFPGEPYYWDTLTDIRIKQFIDYVIGFFSNRFKNKNVIYWFNDCSTDDLINTIKKNMGREKYWQDYNVLINPVTKTITIYSYSYDDNMVVSENFTYGTLTTDIDRVAISWDGLTLRNWNNEKVFYADADTGNLTVEGTIRAKELLIIDENNRATEINDYVDGKTEKISDGTNGIDFSITGYANAQVTINKDVGIKVTDQNNQNYFQTTATQMGFFDSNGAIKMGYNGQDFLVKGTIYADHGKIGYSENDLNAGWTIGTNSLYSGSASSFDADNGIYLGTGGLSVSGNDYKAHFNTSEFKVNINEGDQVLSIDSDGATMTSLSVDNLAVKNLSFLHNITNVYAGATEIYVDATYTYDSTHSNYYSSLQAACDTINDKVINKDITIFISSNVNELITLKGVSGTGTITFECDNAELVLTGRLSFIDCAVRIRYGYTSIQNEFHPPLNINTSDSYGMFIQNCSNVWIEGCVISAANSRGIGIWDSSNVIIIDTQFSNVTCALYVANLSKVYCRDLAGNLSSNQFLNIGQSIIMWSGTRPIGDLEIRDLSICVPSDLNALQTAQGDSPGYTPIPQTIRSFNLISRTYETSYGWYRDDSRLLQGSINNRSLFGCVWLPDTFQFNSNTTVNAVSLTLTRIKERHGRGGNVTIEAYVVNIPSFDDARANNKNPSNYIVADSDLGISSSSHIIGYGASLGESVTMSDATLVKMIQYIVTHGGALMFKSSDANSSNYSANYAIFEAAPALSITCQ